MAMRGYEVHEYRKGDSHTNKRSTTVQYIMSWKKVHLQKYSIKIKLIGHGKMLPT